MAKRRTTTEKLYAYYQASSGISENPNNRLNQMLYFALKVRRPNTKLKIFIWSIWCWLEVHAPSLREIIYQLAARTRWGNDLEGALKEIYDGNGYVETALGNGASLAIVDNKSVHRPPKTFLVKNATQTLYDLAEYHREQIKFPIIGITGTVGKTTTTNLIHTVLSHEMKAYMQNGRNTPAVNSINLLNAPQDSESAVFEMATIKPGLLKGACDILQPTHGLITAVDLAHIDTFGTLENIQQSKWELFEHLIANNGTIFLNMDHAWLSQQSARVPNAIRYGGAPEYETYGIMLSADPFLEVRWFPNDRQVSLDIQTNLAGKHNLDNVLAAIAVGSHFNLNPETIKLAIESFQPVSERSEISHWGTNTVYIETYQSNPASTLANLDSFDLYTAPEKTLILGAIHRTPEEHPVYRQIVDKVKGMNLKHVVFISDKYDRFRPEKVGIHVNGREGVRQWLEEAKPENSFIMLNFNDWDYKICSLLESIEPMKKQNQL